jgi:hypothetical protein
MDNLIYIEMETLISNNCIDIKDIDDFESLISKNDNKNIFFGQRTARNLTGECFLIVFDSVFVVFTYHSKYGIYKTLNDFRNAKKLNIFNAFTYYSLDKALVKYNDFNEYLLSEYQINEIIVLGFEENHSDKEESYYYEFIRLVVELESIKEQYNFNSQQAIIAYIIKDNIDEATITREQLTHRCMWGIEINDKNLRIELHDNFKSQYEKEFITTRYEGDYIEQLTRKGYWEYDEEVFMQYANEIMEKMGIKLNINIEKK